MCSGRIKNSWWLAVLQRLLASATWGNLKRLKELADAHRVQALAYFEEGTPQSVLDLAIKWLGKGNVRSFR